MNRVPHATGKWQVSRNCCTSGNCGKCLGATTGRGPVRVIQGDNYSESYARYVAGNWRDYKAVAEKMQEAAYYMVRSRTTGQYWDSEEWARDIALAEHLTLEKAREICERNFIRRPEILGSRANRVWIVE